MKGKGKGKLPEPETEKAVLREPFNRTSIQARKAAHTDPEEGSQGRKYLTFWLKKAGP